MMIGENRALKAYNFYKTNKPCIFLSHRSLDKNMVIEIGHYIMKAGIDIYLDEYDQNLQVAAEVGDDRAITQYIQKGIEESSHIMCLLSPSTVGSWWVPYEIGFGEKAGKEIASLKLKSLSDDDIPSYIKIRKCLRNIRDLNNYLEEIVYSYTKYPLKEFDYSKIHEYSQYSNASIIKESYYYHPLTNYLERG
ncbi:toll/interleukin-1 receptor domain-containing protein [Thermoanaerobacterium thermosaccharolyticum]|uniref:toll/interleukin-1 receptor domain-containing protein n=1 Tax=Thermoanaerobacterium thermosaccharolyticum TaxID=1517 RepID=UPI0017821E1C|nr:toll/interleukin-1 receptor domain-containing protein [Thermoanaerobacterium thermosaccharolyticum]MBE0069218.1 toll/interleukin-1 receptor domain-containing protein [Thermoanaerobacterium thermosaccharolyticum]MBE0228110.1 toll/interleukin-1 receptor domain-containing protein [Thermoanaerobacterium thermosaccharolyticum]